MSSSALQQPWHQGHNGATNFTRGEAQAFARKLVNSQSYRDSLERRITADKLAPAVECMLWHYAWGKPIEQVNVTVSPGTEDLTNLPLDELYKRAAALAVQLEETAALAAAIPADILQGPWGGAPTAP